jgi:hypothetical protein
MPSLPPSLISNKSYHDFVMVGILNDGPDVKVFIHDTNGNRSDILLVGVKYLLLRDFLLGNVICEVDCYDVTPNNIAIVRECFVETRSEFYTDAGPYDPIHRAEFGDKFLTLSSSFGADLLSICASVHEG